MFLTFSLSLSLSLILEHKYTHSRTHSHFLSNSHKVLEVDFINICLHAEDEVDMVFFWQMAFNERHRDLGNSSLIWQISAQKFGHSDAEWQLVYRKLPSLRLAHKVWRNQPGSRSYQTLFFFIFWFLLLSLSVCNIWKKCIYYKMAELNSKKWKNFAFTKKNILVRLTPGWLRQTLCAKRRDDSAAAFGKQVAIQFQQHHYGQIFGLKLAKLANCFPNLCAVH